MAVGSSEEEGVDTQGEKAGDLLRRDSITGLAEGSMASDGGAVGNSPVQKATYSAVVGKSSQLIKRDVVIEQKDGVQFSVIPSDILSDVKPIWSDILIGRFVDKAPPLAIIHKIVNKIWKWGNPGVKIDAFVVGVNTVKFIIRNESVRMKVLNRRMWNIAKVPMMVEKCAPQSELDDEVVTILPVWITMSDVPRSLYNEKGLGYLASRIGAPKKLHMDTLLCNNFEEAKVLVEADINQDFPSSHRFVSDDGLDVVIKFSYPWLPMKCKVCKGWGHSFRACPSKVAATVSDQTCDKVDGKIGNQNDAEPNKDAEDLMVAIRGEGCSNEAKEVGGDKNSHELTTSINPLFGHENGNVIDDLSDGWTNVGSSSRNLVITEEKTVLLSPNRYKCLEEVVEDGEIREEEEEKGRIGTAAVGDELQAVDKNKQGFVASSSTSLEKVATSEDTVSLQESTRLHSQPTRGAKLSSVGRGRGRGRKKL